MNVTIQPGPRQGRVRIPASKSQAHRLLICAALGEGETELLCGGLSADIRATIDCLKALGAGIRQEGERLWVKPIRTAPRSCQLPCASFCPRPGRWGRRLSFTARGGCPSGPSGPWMRSSAPTA